MLLDPTGRPLGSETREITINRLIEITRSFSYKLNLKNADGSPTYESCDFFCSKKAQCMPDEEAEVSRGLYEFCMEEVLEDIKTFKIRRAAKHGAAMREGRNAA